MESISLQIKTQYGGYWVDMGGIGTLWMSECIASEGFLWHELTSCLYSNHYSKPRPEKNYGNIDSMSIKSASKYTHRCIPPME